ncbi:bZIP transcription factor 30-like [Andrographis paniculata]|uniref:bZIP transcription factor 30-like n=1 Tax=Andrographis paniculata TaxID=175694 RepID=UPI0021E77C27|nr:bZIP transcription factor 30-like [Andrographis paniculata]XP_051151076.1 bZIP transcription factor 30-like [Andrographis paniculata]
MAHTNLEKCPNRIAGSHARSSSQQSIFVNSCLPPLSPSLPSDPSSILSSSEFRNMSIDEVDVSSRGYVSALTSPRGNHFHCSNGLPPRRGPRHRRSNSDVLLGFSDIIQSSPQLVPVGSLAGTMDLGEQKPIGLKRRGMDAVEGKPDGVVADELFDSLMNFDHVDKDKDTVSSNTKMSGGESSNSESETVSRHCPNSGEGIKRSAVGDVTPTPQFRHSRSLSMDSAFGNFDIGRQEDQFFLNCSFDVKLDKSNLEIGQSEFNDFELQKIVADERLAEIAISDPKQAKRILANRQSAARSKERKLRYIFELENKVQTLQTEATTLSAQITLLQKDHMKLMTLNNELKFRVEAMEQQAQLRGALHETLLADVQRLKLANMEIRDAEWQRFPVTTSSTTSAASAAPASA